MVGINTAVLLVKNLGSARRSVMIRMTRPRTIWAASLTSELSSFPVVTKRKLIVWMLKPTKVKIAKMIYSGIYIHSHPFGGVEEAEIWFWVLVFGAAEKALMFCL